MLKIIILREIQEYIKTKKFLIGMLVIICLVVLSTVINLENYKNRYQDYTTALNLQKTLYIKVYRPPQLLSIFATGKDTTLGTTVSLGYGDISILTTGYLGNTFWKDNRLAAGLSSFDLAFLIKMVFSLIVIFFAFNAVAEEKVRGTLKQALANNVPRDTVIVGKFIGGLIVMLLSLLIASFVSLLIITLDSSVMPVFSDWIRILGMFGVSALYLTVIYTLSILVSVIVNRPSTAIMILLQLWLFFTIIYPNTTVILARKFYNIPTIKEILIRKMEIPQEYEKSTREMVGNEIAVRLYEVDREYQSKINSQAKLARNLALFSPAVLYEEAMIRLAKTGMDEFEKFLDGLLPYYMVLIESKSFFGGTDKEKLPAFYYSSEETRKSFAAIIPDVLILFLFGSIFFALAHIMFLRKDVR